MSEESIQPNKEAEGGGETVLPKQPDKISPASQSNQTENKETAKQTETGPRKILEALEKDQPPISQEKQPPPPIPQEEMKVNVPEVATSSSSDPFEDLMTDAMRRLDDILKKFKESQSAS